MNTTQPVKPPPPSPRLCWAAGFDAYCAGRPYSAMADQHMRDGWQEARKAHMTQLEAQAQ